VHISQRKLRSEEFDDDDDDDCDDLQGVYIKQAHLKHR